jgi:hypothetical protein
MLKSMYLCLIKTNFYQQLADYLRTIKKITNKK